MASTYLARLRTAVSEGHGSFGFLSERKRLEILALVDVAEAAEADDAGRLAEAVARLPGGKPSLLRR